MSSAMAKGQAINLAAADAREHNRESDVKYIYSRYVWWLHLCELIQNSPLEEVQTVVDSKDLDKALKQITELMEKVK